VYEFVSLENVAGIEICEAVNVELTRLVSEFFLFDLHDFLFSTEPVSVKGDMFPDQLLKKEEQKLVVVAPERQISREIPPHGSHDGELLGVDE